MDNLAIVIQTVDSAYDSVPEAMHHQERAYLNGSARVSLINQKLEKGIWRGAAYLSISNSTAYEINHNGDTLEEDLTPEERRLERAADLWIETEGECVRCVRCGLPHKGGAFCSDACLSDYTEGLRQKLADNPRAELNVLEKYFAKTLLAECKKH